MRDFAPTFRQQTFISCLFYIYHRPSIFISSCRIALFLLAGLDSLCHTITGLRFSRLSPAFTPPHDVDSYATSRRLRRERINGGLIAKRYRHYVMKVASFAWLQRESGHAHAMRARVGPLAMLASYNRRRTIDRWTISR